MIGPVLSADKPFLSKLAIGLRVDIRECTEQERSLLIAMRVVRRKWFEFLAEPTRREEVRCLLSEQRFRETVDEYLSNTPDADRRWVRLGTLGRQANDDELRAIAHRLSDIRTLAKQREALTKFRDYRESQSEEPTGRTSRQAAEV